MYVGRRLPKSLPGDPSKGFLMTRQCVWYTGTGPYKPPLRSFGTCHCSHSQYAHRPSRASHGPDKGTYILADSLETSHQEIQESWISPHTSGWTASHKETHHPSTLSGTHQCSRNQKRFKERIMNRSSTGKASKPHPRKRQKTTPESLAQSLGSTDSPPCYLEYSLSPRSSLRSPS